MAARASMSKLNPNAAAWTPKDASLPGCAPPDGNERGALLDQPPEMLGAILAAVEDAKDVLSAISACKALMVQASSAPLCLDLSCTGIAPRPDSGGAAASGSKLTSGETTCPHMVAALLKYMPGVVSLKLSGQPLEDADVLALVSGLPRLQHLELASCRKVTCALVSSLLAAPQQQQPSAGAPGVTKGVGVRQSRAHLRALNLQRCFQLRTSALSELLCGVHVGLLPSLGVLAMSHLDLSHLDLTHLHLLHPSVRTTTRSNSLGARDTNSDGEGSGQSETTVPAAVPTTNSAPTSPTATSHSSFSSSAAAAASSSSSHSCSSCVETYTTLTSFRSTPGSALTVLALNNCSGVGGQALATLATLCPHLRYLMLGGCTWATNVAAATPQGLADGVGGTAHAAAATSAAAAVRVTLPQLRTALQAHGHGWGLAGTAAGTAPGASGTGPTRLCGSRAPRGTPLAADAPWMVEVAATLAAMVLQLPHLRAVELTFFPPPVLSRVAAALTMFGGAPAVRSSAPAGPHHGAESSVAPAPPQLWDLTLASCVAQASQALRDLHTTPTAAASSAGAALGVPPASEVSALRLALRCASNCSNTARATPLHAAAERGDECALRGLLALGACVDSKERGGAAPLFLAAEAGHVACVVALLEAGANPQVANAAGEMPLYIASLKGHVTVVKLLLEHCHSHNIAWQDAALYGDRFSPLMAAAVADRVDVAQALLRAAGGPSPAASSLVGAVNRYGQCVLHIAARKASSRLLQLLLSYCCSQCSGSEPRPAQDGSALCTGPEDQQQLQGTFQAPASPLSSSPVAPAAWAGAWAPASPRSNAQHLHKCAVVLADSNGDTPLDVARKNRNSGALAELTRGLQQLAMASSCSASTAHHHHHHHHHGTSCQRRHGSLTASSHGAGGGMGGAAAAPMTAVTRW